MTKGRSDLRRKKQRSLLAVIGASIQDGSYKHHTFQAVIAVTLVGWGYMFLA